MKTETIEVPYFEGFECVGVCAPDREKHYILNAAGDGLVSGFGMYSQLCYKKVEPVRITLECVGKCEMRPGDYVRTENGMLVPYEAILLNGEMDNVWRTVNE